MVITETKELHVDVVGAKMVGWGVCGLRSAVTVLFCSEVVAVLASGKDSWEDWRGASYESVCVRRSENSGTMLY